MTELYIAIGVVAFLCLLLFLGMLCMVWDSARETWHDIRDSWDNAFHRS